VNGLRVALDLRDASGYGSADSPVICMSIVAKLSDLRCVARSGGSCSFCHELAVPLPEAAWIGQAVSLSSACGW
jgi:hypothetical protein